MFPLVPSDLMLILDLILAVVLSAYFALGRPRVWHKDRLGWVIFSYSVAVVALLFLIAYGIVFDQKIAEPVRLVVGALLAGTLVAKTYSVYRERREARTHAARKGEDDGHVHS
jgi:hypothetical protein